MDYELCKKLKDAGFPLDSWDFLFALSGPGNKVGRPTLSELIEACLKIENIDCFRLEKDCVMEIQENGCVLRWNAECFNQGFGNNKVKCFGSTAEEAVANLYLELHK